MLQASIVFHPRHSTPKPHRATWKVELVALQLKKIPHEVLREEITHADYLQNKPGAKFTKCDTVPPG